MKRILFVCTGNICRSPTAEGVFRSLVKEMSLEDKFEIDSAGLQGFHEGDGPDPRTLRAASQRGFDLSQICSRPINSDDFEKFDYLIAMDKTHLEALKELCPQSIRNKKVIRLMMDYSHKWKGMDVPDPYYDKEKGFEIVLDMIEEACENFLSELKN